MCPSDTDHLLAEARHVMAMTSHDITWATRLQDVVVRFWSTLDQKISDDSIDEILDTFVQLLSSEEALQLAKLVVPDLRKNDAAQHENENKRRVVKRLSLPTVHYLTDHDTPFYRSEKEMLAQAELYRARIAFESTQPMSEHEKSEFRQWWDSNPLRRQPLQQEDSLQTGHAKPLDS
ncbi:hypothetical protein KCU78_g1278, partial [Aureobasidium melanogenum]